MIRFEVTQESISAEVKKEKPVDMVVQDTVLLKIHGKSAYEIALQNGFEGTEEEWLESLKGDPGEKGEQGDVGPAGPQGPAGADGAPGKDGQPGRDGVDGKDGAPGKDGEPGKDGKDGADGFSPSVAVSDIDGGHRVTITDKDGEKTFDVMDGKDGAPGSSVTVTSVSSSSADGGVNRVFLSDGTILNIRNGSKGSPGEAGAQGPQGPQGERGLAGLRGLPGTPGMDGADGFSPSVAVSDIDGGHRVTITDKDGAKAFDVMDGAGGGTVHWNDMEDRPFGEMPTGGDTLYWDGNTEGLLEVNVPYCGTFYKVSDVALSNEDVYCEDGTGKPIVKINEAGYEFVFNDEIAFMTDDIIRQANYASNVDGVNYPEPYKYPVVCYADAAVCVFEDNVKIGVFEFPEKGVYLASFARSFWLLNCTKFPSTKLMDKRYLPMSDITAAVLSALPIYNGEVEEV